jgi:hypothetical protein
LPEEESCRMFDSSVKPCVTAERASLLIFLPFGVVMRCVVMRAAFRTLNRLTQLFAWTSGADEGDASVSQ